MLDSTDAEIIQFLQLDARSSYTEIARKMKMNEATIRNRVNKLEELGIIKKYTLLLDHHKLGYDTRVIVGVDIDPENFLSVSKKISELPEARRVFTCTGDHMVLFEAWFTNQAELTTFLEKEIKSLSGITRICPAIVLDQLK